MALGLLLCEVWGSGLVLHGQMGSAGEQLPPAGSEHAGDAGVGGRFGSK